MRAESWSEILHTGTTRRNQARYEDSLVEEEDIQSADREGERRGRES